MRQLIMLNIVFMILGVNLVRGEEKEVIPEKPKTQIVFKKEESHKFSGSKLKGHLKKPELSYIYQRKGLRAEKIVNVPENFNDEIIKGAGQF